jgi:acetyltransferase-like isoleucine patch superfamily enzyme
MYLLINKLNTWRNNKTRKWFYELKLKTIFFIRNILAFCRGLLISFTGKIKYVNAYLPLVIGAQTQLIVRPGSSIILRHDKETASDVFPNNPMFLTAITIGTRPHYLALDPPALSTTRIELLENAELILEQNTIILSGSYIIGSHNTKIEIGKNSYLSQEVIINSRHSIQIGKNVLIGHQVIMMDYDAHTIIYHDSQQQNNQSDRVKRIIIGDNVWIGARVTILKGVTIGDGSIIGANSCVISDIPPNTIAVGNPAKIVRNTISWQR